MEETKVIPSLRYGKWGDGVRLLGPRPVSLSIVYLTWVSWFSGLKHKEKSIVTKFVCLPKLNSVYIPLQIYETYYTKNINTAKYSPETAALRPTLPWKCRISQTQDHSTSKKIPPRNKIMPSRSVLQDPNNAFINKSSLHFAAPSIEMVADATQ